MTTPLSDPDNVKMEIINEEKEYDGPIIELGIHMNFDAQSHYRWIKAPADWVRMSQKEKDAFLDQEAEEWFQQECEWSHAVYDSREAAREETKKYWGTQYSDDQLEDIYD